MNIYKYVIRRTKEIAGSMLANKCPEIDIEFSLCKTRYMATCWPNQYRIRYYRYWLEANKFNTRFIDDCIIHECTHFVTGPDHDKRFYRQCKKYGALYEDKYFDEIPYHIEFPEYIIEKYGEIECN